MKSKHQSLLKVIILISTIIGCDVFETAYVRVQTEKQKGITYVTWWHGRFSEPDSDISLNYLAATGANWISLVVTHYQENYSTTEIFPTEATPTDEDLNHVITLAHNLGLGVMLKPHIDLDNDSDHWRGQIGDGFNDFKWSEWFASYELFIGRYAQFAQDHNVDLFCIGTELSRTQIQESRWRETIFLVRSKYDGPITYAANHGGEEKITWWDALDFIGVDAYYRITKENDPTVDDLIDGWKPHVESLKDVSTTWQKPVIITELGYRSRNGANQQGWGGPEENTIDMQELADAYEAAFLSLYNQPWLAGIYWWNLRV
jgi:hypothetical protein